MGINYFIKKGGIILLFLTSFLATSQSTTWDGSAWSNGVPDNTKDAIIEGDYNSELNGVFIAKRLYNNIGTFTVSSGTTIRVVYGVFNNQAADKFVVENNGNLRQTAANAFNSGDITVFRNSSSIARLDYTIWSSPVSSQNLKEFSPETLNDRFYTYNPNTNVFASIDPLGSNFIPGYGYMIRAANNHPTTPTIWNGKFVGVPNNGPITTYLKNFGVGNSFNFVGNPYPCPITITGFLTDNASNVYGTIYFWRKPNSLATTGWSACTAAGCTLATGSGALNPNGIIRQGQGFLVELQPGITQVEFNNTMKSNSVSDRFFRSSTPNVEEDENATPKDAYWINLKKGDEVLDQILVAYSAKTTNDFDMAFDGKSYPNYTNKIYTSIENNDERYVIQARSLDGLDKDKIALGFEVENASTYRLELDMTQGVFENKSIFIEDLSNNTVHNLSERAFEFSTISGNYAERFKLFYADAKIVKNNILDINTNIFVSNNVLTVQSKEMKIKTIHLLDLEGRRINSLENVNDLELQTNISKFSGNVMLLEVIYENGEVVKKKIIK